MIGYSELPKRIKNKNLLTKLSLKKKNGFMTSSSNISSHPFGEIHWWTLSNKTVLSLKMLSKTSSNILKSSKSSFQYVPSLSRVLSKKLESQRRLWKNVLLEDLNLKKTEKSSLKSLFAITLKCSKESWYLRIKNFKRKL